jgi:hypothetical protein
VNGARRKTSKVMFEVNPVNELEGSFNFVASSKFNNPITKVIV